ncbi:MAG: 50S ribosomal protein L3 [Planctomycetes bacterium]|nr:50S ribosomal protein L3 [Planctomycetota bacterium]
MTLILGRKEGMTQFFAEDGTLVGVTVVAAGPCVISQVRTAERDGYDAVQLGFDDVGDKHLTRPLAGHFRKVGVAPKRYLREERLTAPTAKKVGDSVTVEAFAVGQLVDVTGTMKGRGFSGTIRRHGFSRGPAGHGSMNVRAPGSIATKRIGKVAKGKRMAGQFGNVRRTVKNIRVVRIDSARNLLFLAGSVPGPRGGYVQVCSAKTAAKKVAAK